ncbi:MAG: sensor histidine kinase [Acidimicrobiales bacterium]
MSLRGRLLCALGLIAAVLVVSGAVLLGLVRTSLVQQIDRQLAAVAPVTANDGPGQLTPLVPPPASATAPEVSPFTELFIGQYSASGDLQVVLRPSGGEVPSVDVGTAQARATEPTHTEPFDARSADGTAGFRVASVRSPGGTTSLVALPMARVEATYRRVRLGVVAVGVALFAALALAGWWVERLGIRPIKRVTDAATAIAGGELDHRVEAQPQGTEAAQLAAAFNVMADRRQAAESKLRQFVADASHELRTPLSTVAGVLELYQSGALEVGPGLDDALRRARQETTRMSALVSDLLLLAYLDQGRPLEAQPVDLTALVADAAFDASLSDPGRHVTTDLAADAVVVGDEHRLRQVVSNLVANALAHTPPDAAVSLKVTTSDDLCVLEVSDDGPGMTAEQASHVFDRFYRCDDGRSRSQGGSGLGLSIVASILEAHGGGVSVETAPGEGARFRVVLPRHRPSPQNFEETSRESEGSVETRTRG